MKVLQAASSVRLAIAVLLSFAVFALSSCNSYYQSNLQQVPLMQNKGDFRFSVGTKDIQSSYAISDQLALLANGHYRQHSWELDSIVTEFHGQTGLFNERKRTSKLAYGELGAGYFKSGGGSALIFEMYGGLGFGNLNYEGDFSSEQEKMKTSFNRVFVQPTFGIKREQYEIAVSTRFSTMALSRLTTEHLSAAERNYEVLTGIDDAPHLFAEPAITFRAGLPQLKFQVQAAFEAKLNNRSFSTAPLRLSVGLQLDLNTSKKFDE